MNSNTNPTPMQDKEYYIKNIFKSRKDIRYLFNSIADFYETINKILSLGLDGRWRDKVSSFAEGVSLDIACGTGEMTYRISCRSKSHYVVGLDISEKMIRWGLKNRSFCSKVSFVVSAGEFLPFKDDSFDSVSVAFGIRNFEDRISALREIKRVLKNNGLLLVLDTFRPKSKTLKFLYKVYLHAIPHITNFLVGRFEEYLYMSKSILNYMTADEFADFLSMNNFYVERVSDMTFGIVSFVLAINRK